MNRVLISFGLAVCVEGVLFLINRYCYNYRASEIPLAAALQGYIMPGLMWAGLAALLAGGAWALSLHRAGRKTAPAVATAVTGGALFACFGLCIAFGQISVRVMQVLAVVLAVFSLIFFLYQKEFFACAAAVSLGIFGLWLYRRGFAAHPAVVYAYAAGMAAVLLCAALFFRRVQKGDGALALGGKPMQIFPRGGSYKMIYLSCALAAGAMVLALALGGAAAYYAIFALVAWLFVMAVYHTVRLL